MKTAVKIHVRAEKDAAIAAALQAIVTKGAK
jgi:hypothetical protein